MPCSNAPSKPSHPKSKPCTAPGTNTTKPEQTKSSRSQQASSSKPPCHIWRPRSGNRSPPNRARLPLTTFSASSERNHQMTDHHTEANRLIDGLRNLEGRDANFDMALAQVHATLALAEQQRIANLIELLPGIEMPETGGAIAQADGLTEIVRKTNHEGREYGMYQLRPEIARALRIETPMTDQTPIERAAQAIRDDWQMGRQATELDRRDGRTAFESIAADQLADVILAATRVGDGTAMDAAQAVKNWLTGKVIQQ